MRISAQLFAAALLALAAASTAAQAQHGSPQPAGQSANLQGEDPRKFVDNPHMHRFYELSVATLRPGAPPLDLKAYEASAYEIFRAFGESRIKGGGPAMVEHLKLIPGQVVQIAKDDPKVLDSFDAFADALVGPK
ncbi:hypothetical protein [Phenylobacterium sp.]|uniref:hypothetical protein n=1 Tax=Phenylobacterium sp. TaxID=1871053 RepID=UPI0025D3DC65|nr:hypothetical protein [Phenylobacterium sp.]